MKRKKNIFFKRTVLAAKIASQLFNQPTFGHVKFQKLVYLCEQVGKMNLHDNYSKQAAGPYDRKFMHSIDAELKRQKWFDVKLEKKDGFTKYTYTPSENMLKYQKYYNRYFSTYDNKIQWIIEKFKTAKSNQVELIATLYSCWVDIYYRKAIFSDDLLMKDFYKWSPEKEKFNEKNVRSAINWMKNNDLTPLKNM